MNKLTGPICIVLKRRSTLTLPLSHQQLLRTALLARPYHREQPARLHSLQEVSRVVRIISLALAIIVFGLTTAGTATPIPQTEEPAPFNPAQIREFTPQSYDLSNSVSLPFLIYPSPLLYCRYSTCLTLSTALNFHS
jgi:hypothetical protein